MMAGCGSPRTSPRAPSFSSCCSPTVRRLPVHPDESNPTTSYLVRASERSLWAEYGLRSLDKDAQLRRQRCTPRVIEVQSILLDRALRQQPFEAALADVAARPRFTGRGDADAHRRKLKRHVS